MQLRGQGAAASEERQAAAAAAVCRSGIDASTTNGATSTFVLLGWRWPRPTRESPSQSSLRQRDHHPPRAAAVAQSRTELLPQPIILFSLNRSSHCGRRDRLIPSTVVAASGTLILWSRRMQIRIRILPFLPTPHALLQYPLQRITLGRLNARDQIFSVRVHSACPWSRPADCACSSFIRKEHCLIPRQS